MKCYDWDTRRKQFLDRVAMVPEAGCWIWLGGNYAVGYGGFSLDGIKDYAHRCSYRLFRGPIPADKIVCHRCDVKMCVNPEHMYIGTQSDNAFDVVRRSNGTFQNRVPNNRHLGGYSGDV